MIDHGGTDLSPPEQAYAELAVTSNFSFLEGASHPEDMIIAAAALGYSGIGLADRNTLAGVVRAHVAMRDLPPGSRLRFSPGARLVFHDGTPDILAYPQDRAAWGRLSRLLTLGNSRAEKGACHLGLDDLLAFQEGLQLILMPGAALPATLQQLRQAAEGRLWFAAICHFRGSMRRALAQRHALAARWQVPLIACNDVLMHDPARRALADVLACIRRGLTLDKAGRLLEPHAERHLKAPGEMARLFAGLPQALAQTQVFMNGLHFSLDELHYEYPHELRAGYADSQEALAAFAMQGAAMRYPEGIPARIAATITHELSLVAQMNYAPYFLTVHDIVRFARQRGILCQGRGSAANSTICYCLGITEVDPAVHDLLFERFISPERKEPPDIDVDFEHERREEVIQYIYARYGRERAGLAASVTTYRARSSIRETGKVFGLSEDMLNALSGTIWGWKGKGLEDDSLRRAGLDPQAPLLRRAMQLAQEIEGFPRHLSQHTGGFVITQSRLDDVVPILNAAMPERTTVEWDKNDLDALGILKIDVLALGMLTCIRRAFDLCLGHYGVAMTLANLPQEDVTVYDMVARADTIGVFQIESRAQMSMLPRLKPATFYDLVIEVAIVRPGPIQGDMVHPYLRRRQGFEKVVFPSRELEDVLGKTLGVPLFQEQAMRIAIVAAGFTPGEADQLRRAMATFKKVGTISSFGEKMVKGMVARGYDEGFATRCFRQIEGFGTYGFPESHAASFALLVYASAYLKCHYPDVFACALLNSQPMGFYAPAQIVRDAREHGIEVREVDVNASYWESTLEPGGAGMSPHPRHAAMREVIKSSHALRLGFNQIKGLSQAEVAHLVACRGQGFDSLRDLWLRSRLTPAVLQRLAEADAFLSLGLDRRDALWAVKGLNRAGDRDDLPLFVNADLPVSEPDAHLPPMLPGEHVVEDYRHLRLSLKGHPVGFLRARLQARGILPLASLDPPTGLRPTRATIAGLVLVRQRPGTAKGVIFMTLEDETGSANIIVWPKQFEKQRAIVIGARFVAVTGRVQSEAGVTHLIAERLEDLSVMLGQLSSAGRNLASLARADEIKRPVADSKVPMLAAALMAHETPAGDARAMPKARNFR